jgi:hypothetical protein
MFRFDIINFLIEKNNLNSYLEIGIFDGENISKINTKIKHGVDPGAEGVVSSYVTHKCTSDIFFSTIDSNIKYDIIFIDGLHHADQVAKDIINSLNHLSGNGYLVLHDCIPPNYESQIIPRQTLVWTGDVWRAFVGFRLSNTNIDSWTIDTDHGVGIIKNDISKTINNFIPVDMSYSEFEKNKEFLLQIISIENLESILMKNN